MGLKVTGELLPRVATFKEQINSLFYPSSSMDLEHAASTRTVGGSSPSWDIKHKRLWVVP